jgi:hypothetical protein
MIGFNPLEGCKYSNDWIVLELAIYDIYGLLCAVYSMADNN